MPVLLWLGVLIGITLAGGLLLMWYRRKVLGHDGQEDQGGFMDELRRARDRGEMSDVEFEAARRQMIAKLRGAGSVGRTTGPNRTSRHGFHDSTSTRASADDPGDQEQSDRESGDGV